MTHRFIGSTIAAGVVVAVFSPTKTPAASQTPPAAIQARTLPRTPDGKPNLSGIWQVMNAASWDIQDHAAQKGIPGGQGVVDGNEIPYQPAAAAKKKENDFNDETWFDRAGNFHSDALHVVERYTLTDPGHIDYEATIEDPKVFTRPWKMRMPLYRHTEKDFQLLEYECNALDDETLR